MGALRQEVEMLRKQNQEYQVGALSYVHHTKATYVTWLTYQSWHPACQSLHVVLIAAYMQVTDESCQKCLV